MFGIVLTAMLFPFTSLQLAKQVSYFDGCNGVFVAPGSIGGTLMGCLNPQEELDARAHYTVLGRDYPAHRYEHLRPWHVKLLIKNFWSVSRWPIPRF